MTKEDKVRYAPEAVIEELDSYKPSTPRELLNIIADNSTISRETHKWIYDGKVKSKQLAVINHVFNNEFLQPQDKARYYVEFLDFDGTRTFVRKNAYYPACLTVFEPDYKHGVDHATAVKAQALYGGTIEEIK